MRALSARLLGPYQRAAGAAQWPAAVNFWIEKIAEGKASPAETAQALLAIQNL